MNSLNHMSSGDSSTSSKSSPTERTVGDAAPPQAVSTQRELVVASLLRRPNARRESPRHHRG